MSDTPLTRERILEAAVDVLRRFGSDRATVVDVARALKVSHGSVYRHFASKEALREAVTEAWLASIAQPLATITHQNDPALQRLRTWLNLLVASKRQFAQDDPELFANYVRLASEARQVVQAHVATLCDQLEQMLADGVAAGEISVADPKTTARAVLDATARFHDPRHADAWTTPGIDSAFEAVWSLLLHGLGAPHNS